MTWGYKIQQGNHNVSQSMHKMQICHVYDMSIEHDMCEHNQQIWRCWYTNTRCCGMSGGSKVHPINLSAPQLEGPWVPSPMSVLHPIGVTCRQEEGNNNERVTHPICIFEDGSKGRSSPHECSRRCWSCTSCMPSHNQNVS